MSILFAIAFFLMLFFMASRENSSFYYDPTQVAEGHAPSNRDIRVGGIIAKGSLIRTPAQKAHFVLTDYAHQIAVKYNGVVEDTFNEGQNVTVHGKLASDGSFVGDELFALSVK